METIETEERIQGATTAPQNPVASARQQLLLAQPARQQLDANSVCLSR
jgi:hypothetical protein